MAATGKRPSREAKQRIVEYYNNNQVPVHIENLLNEMCIERPEDIFGYMSNHFKDLAKPPAILKVEGREVLSAQGFKTCQADLHCLINGVPKYVCSASSPVDTKPPPENAVAAPSKAGKSPTHQDKAKTPDTARSMTPEQEGSVKERLTATIDDMINRISNEISPLLIGINPTDQRAVDNLISEYESSLKPQEQPQETQSVKEEQEEEAPSTKEESSEPQDVNSAESVECPGVDNAILAVSLAASSSGASLLNIPLYQHFANIYEVQDPEGYALPLPAMVAISSGRTAPGKQNLIKQILLVPQPGNSMKQDIDMLTSVYYELGRVAATKFGVSGGLVGKDGGYSPVLDKPESALECIQEAVELSGYQMGEHISLIINCAADEIFDQEKQKYEIIMNTFKSGDDLINLYAEWLDRFPSLLAIVDGIKSKDEETWLKLSKRLGETCFISTQNLLNINPLYISTGVERKIFSMGIVNLGSSSTVSETAKKCQNIRDQTGTTMLEDCLGNNPSTFVELAVGIGVRFVKLPAPCGESQIKMYNRLVDISSQLDQEGKLLPRNKHVFPVITEPEPEPEPDEQSTEGQQENDKEPSS